MKDRLVHQIGLPYHWGTEGIVRGDSANFLISFVADPNVSIQESKAFTVMIEAGRHSEGRRRATSGPLVEDLHTTRKQRDVPRARQSKSAHSAKMAESKEGRSN
jgi:formate dehydrogenase major subunit